jgi:hypothetical protein
MQGALPCGAVGSLDCRRANDLQGEVQRGNKDGVRAGGRCGSGGRNEICIATVDWDDNVRADLEPGGREGGNSIRENCRSDEIPIVHKLDSSSRDAAGG